MITMTKNDRIINIVFNTIRIRLNKSHLNSSTINNNGIYSVEPNFRRKENYWHLVLINNRQKKLFVFEIPENHKVYDELYKRTAEGRYRLLFDLDDMSFRERLSHKSFSKFLAGTCEYNEDIF